MTEFNYTMARPIGSAGAWERVLEADCPRDAMTLSPLGPDDCFRLEQSGWTSRVEFKPKNSHPPQSVS